MKFRNIIRVALAVALIAGIAGNADAAKKRTKGKAKARTTAAAPAVTKGETKSYGDNLSTQMFKIKKGESVIEVEYPVAGDPAIVGAIRKMIADAVAGTYKNDNFVPYSGPLDTPDDFMKKTIRGYASKGSYGSDKSTIEQTVKVIYSNGNVVTYSNEGYEYSGGAHGMPWSVGTSYLLSDGTKLTGDLLPGISTMRSYLVDALAREAQISPYEFDDVFFVKSNELGFPGGTNPYITSDGLTYRYSAYEIGPYAMGMPEAVIPFSAARSLVAGKAAEFLK